MPLFSQDNLEREYAALLQKLKSKITSNLPKVEESLKDIFHQACVSVVSAQATRDACKRAQDAASTEPEQKAANEALAQAEKTLSDATDMAVATATPILESLNKDLVDAKLDDALMPCTILYRATPKALAGFASQSESKKALIDQLLANENRTMADMLAAGGAKKGQYGNAMQIYTTLCQQSESLPHSSVLQRLALGVALQLAEPMSEFDLPDVQVDPQMRYLHYEQAYLLGELDPIFSKLSAWELRYCIDSDAPNEQLGWGREMLRNYRPDLMQLDNEQWRYCMAVRTEVAYKRPEWTSEPRTYQQIISGGGQCGPRARFGRFICKSFGIPTWGVRQPGHAAMTRYSTTGWVVRLGAAWPFCTWEGRWGPDFLLETEARKSTDYATVDRLEWVANALGEPDLDAMKGIVNPDQLWRSLALMQKKRLAANTSNRIVGRNEHAVLTPVERLASKLALKKETVLRLSDDRIIVPATACSDPKASSDKVMFVPSFLGGSQLHLREDGKVEYTLTGLKGGSYQMELRVVTVHLKQQRLMLSIGDSTKPIQAIEVPYTVGEWSSTKPVKVELSEGTNLLRFTRSTPSNGLTVKDFTLTPC